MTDSKTGGPQRHVAVVLVHHPILDRGGNVVTTAITNLDLHDIARSAHTYDVSDYFVVHPVAAQRELALRVRDHWVDGAGGRRIPDRIPAMKKLRIVETLADAIDGVPECELWTTSAQASAEPLSFAQAREQLRQPGSPVMLCFGTGWGLAPAVNELATQRLEPIVSPRADGYNHLSVRAAAAIVFDRLLGGDTRVSS